MLAVNSYICNTGATNAMSLWRDCLFANQWQIRKTVIYFTIPLNIITIETSGSEITHCNFKIIKLIIRGSLAAQLCGHF